MPVSSTVVLGEGLSSGAFYSTIFVMSILSHVFNPYSNPKLQVSGVVLQDSPRQVFSIYPSLRASWVRDDAFLSSLDLKTFFFFFFKDELVICLRERKPSPIVINPFSLASDWLEVGQWPISKPYDINGICWRFQKIFSYLIRQTHAQGNAPFFPAFELFLHEDLMHGESRNTKKKAKKSQKCQPER